MKTSSLFVPLAEEYIKKGMLDEAMSVLQEGLRVHPNYLGARVSLGKVYLEKGMISEALEEFQKVVQVSPDNLYAHRKLANLYGDLGRIPEAVAACQNVLEFAPKDTEATALLADLVSNQRKEIAPDALSPADASVGALSTGSPSPEENKIDFTEGWHVSREDSEELETETLADLYVRQGKGSQGAAIYRRLLEKDPLNERVRHKVTEFEGEKETFEKKDFQIRRLESWLERIQSGQR